MPFVGSERTGKTHQPDHDDDDRVGIAEVEVAATHFLQEKKYADSYHNDWAAKTTKGATLAVAIAITHRCVTSRRSLLRARIHPVSKHQDAHGD